MDSLRRSFLVLPATLLLAVAGFGQAKKQYTFHGKVESVNRSAGSMSVNGEAIKGWMGAMTMNYKIDNPAILSKVKPGDRIEATVYDGDYILHNVRIDHGASKSKK